MIEKAESAYPGSACVARSITPDKWVGTDA
jgi:hypothetical protein